MLETQGVSQRELAARIDRNDAQVNRLIRGAGNTSLKSLARIAYGLGFRFALVPIPFEDREGTPAASDPPPPPWLEKQRRRRAGEAPATAPEELTER
jgi:transcriptional regulator with XRE-family HTH domain